MRLCVRLHLGDKHHLRKSADRKAQIRKAFVPLTGLICAFRSADFLGWCLSPKCNVTHNLFFLFPIVFGINSTMEQTSKTDHFFKLAPFLSPLTDFIDFGIAGKLLTSATRRCSLFVDSVSSIWIKPKKSLIGCWAPTATTFGQSAPPRVQLTAGRNGHNRHFERMSLLSSVCRSLSTGKIELYVSWVAYFRGVLPWLQRTAVTPVGFACTGAILRVIVKVTSSSDLENIRARSKSTRRQAGRFQRRGLLRTLNKQFWER